MFLAPGSRMLGILVRRGLGNYTRPAEAGRLGELLHKSQFRIPFDVGRPIMQNTEASMSLRLKPNQTAVISLPRDENDRPPIFMMLKARLIRR